MPLTKKKKQTVNRNKYYNALYYRRTKVSKANEGRIKKIITLTKPMLKHTPFEVAEIEASKKRRTFLTITFSQ